MKDAMVVGYDLYHDSSQRGKTVGAAVSSLDTHFTKWSSQCRLHDNPTELGENLGHFVQGQSVRQSRRPSVCYCLMSATLRK